MHGASARPGSLAQRRLSAMDLVERSARSFEALE
jgi:hypothetical protein